MLGERLWFCVFPFGIHRISHHSYVLVPRTRFKLLYTAVHSSTQQYTAVLIEETANYVLALGSTSGQHQHLPAASGQAHHHHAERGPCAFIHVSHTTAASSCTYTYIYVEPSSGLKMLKRGKKWKNDDVRYFKTTAKRAMREWGGCATATNNSSSSINSSRVQIWCRGCNARSRTSSAGAACSLTCITMMYCWAPALRLDSKQQQ